MPCPEQLKSLSVDTDRHVALDTGDRRVIIVGDVHGCYDELCELERRFFRVDDCVILAGDLVNKGPDSVAVVDWAVRKGAFAVLGNHDLAGAGPALLAHAPSLLPSLQSVAHSTTVASVHRSCAQPLKPGIWVASASPSKRSSSGRQRYRRLTWHICANCPSPYRCLATRQSWYMLGWFRACP